MTHAFSELVIGGVFITPFIAYAFVAGIAFMLLRPLLRLARLEQLVSNPPLVELSLYVLILATLIALL